MRARTSLDLTDFEGERRAGLMILVNFGFGVVGTTRGWTECSSEDCWTKNSNGSRVVKWTVVFGGMEGVVEGSFVVVVMDGSWVVEVVDRVVGFGVVLTVVVVGFGVILTVVVVGFGVVVVGFGVVVVVVVVVVGTVVDVVEVEVVRVVGTGVVEVVGTGVVVLATVVVVFKVVVVGSFVVVVGLAVLVVISSVIFSCLIVLVVFLTFGRFFDLTATSSLASLPASSSSKLCPKQFTSSHSSEVT